MTKDQLIHFLTQSKTKKLLQASQWSDLTASLGNLTADEKDNIAKLIATGGGQTVVNRLQAVMRENASARASTAVTTALSDDNLTLAELDDLL